MQEFLAHFGLNPMADTGKVHLRPSAIGLMGLKGAACKNQNIHHPGYSSFMSWQAEVEDDPMSATRTKSPLNILPQYKTKTSRDGSASESVAGCYSQYVLFLENKSQ